MSVPSPLPSQDHLRQFFIYDPETGALTWRAGGKPALTARKNGYLRGELSGRMALAHRVIWKLMTGDEPRQVDHINGDRADNRWCNLRDVAHQTNGRNQKKPSTNTSGVCGVGWHRGAQKWQARIRVNDRHIYLGLFDTMEEAVSVRKTAERDYGFHPNHGRAA